MIQLQVGERWSTHEPVETQLSSLPWNAQFICYPPQPDANESLVAAWELALINLVSPHCFSF